MEQQEEKLELYSACRSAAANGCVLLKNEDHTLPLEAVGTDFYDSLSAAGDSVFVFETRTGQNSAAGPGAAMTEYDNAAERDTTVSELKAAAGRDAAESGLDSGASDREEVRRTAVVIIGSTPHNQPVDMEQKLQEAAANADRIVLVLCTPEPTGLEILDRDPWKEIVKAVLWAGDGGHESTAAIADVLTGVVCPSGKLTVTVPYRDGIALATEQKKSSWECFEERSTIDRNIRGDSSSDSQVVGSIETPTGSHVVGVTGGSARTGICCDVYTGYRYFETFAPEEVRYPFGFGLSYSTFTLKEKKGEILSQAAGTFADVIRFTMKITNNGPYNARENVQVYAEAPQGKMGKPVRRLAAFKKTDTMYPGETADLEIYFPVSRMASYDDTGVTGYKDAWVLERGKYRFFVGTDIRNAEEIRPSGQDGYALSDTLLIEQLEAACGPTDSFVRLKPTFTEEQMQTTYEIPRAPLPDLPGMDEELMRIFYGNQEAEKAELDFASMDPEEEEYMRAMYTRVVGTAGKGCEMVGQLALDTTCSATEEQAEKDCGKLAGTVPPDEDAANAKNQISTEADREVQSQTITEPVITRDIDGDDGTLPSCRVLASTWDPQLVGEVYKYRGRLLKEDAFPVLGISGKNGSGREAFSEHSEASESNANGCADRFHLGKGFLFSEDPYLAGTMLTMQIAGLQMGDADAVVKCGRLNGQVVSGREFREISMKPLEMAVAEGSAHFVLVETSGEEDTYTTELTHEVMRKQWGYTGLILLRDCQA